MAENVPKALTPSAFTPFGGEFDQLFNRMVRAWSFGFLEPVNGHMRTLGTHEHAPKVEVQENGKTYTITVELPGLDQKDVKVLVEDDVLTISGEKHVERDVDCNGATVQSGEQIRTPTSARSQIDDHIGRARMQRHHGDGKIVQ